jgi:cobalamin biosynthesis Mg chelatase CobN
MGPAECDEGWHFRSSCILSREPAQVDMTLMYYLRSKTIVLYQMEATCLSDNCNNFTTFKQLKEAITVDPNLSCFINDTLPVTLSSTTPPTTTITGTSTSTATPTGVTTSTSSTSTTTSGSGTTTTASSSGGTPTTTSLGVTTTTGGTTSVPTTTGGTTSAPTTTSGSAEQLFLNTKFFILIISFFLYN